MLDHAFCRLYNEGMGSKHSNPLEREGEVAELTLVSTAQRPLKPLIEAALANELRLLEAGIRRTQYRLHELEAQYQLSTDEFIRRFEDDELGETLEFAEWVGEYRLLERLYEKAGILRGIEFAN